MSRVVTTIGILLFIVSPMGRSQNTWRRIQPGLERLDGAFKDSGQTVRFVLVRCDPKKSSIRVIDTFHELRSYNALSAFSLREVSENTHAAIVVNAGATTSFSLPAPSGLLQIGGKVLHPPSYSGDGAANILCVAKGRLSIVSLKPNTSANCIDAVQKGPILTPNFKSAPSKNQRTIVALDSAGMFIILVTVEDTSLSAVAEYLYHSKPALNIQSALNLDGGSSSGMIINSEKQPEIVGNVDSLVASAITVSNR